MSVPFCSIAFPSVSFIPFSSVSCMTLVFVWSSVGSVIFLSTCRHHSWLFRGVHQGTPLPWFRPFAIEFAVPGLLPRDALSPVTTVTSSTVVCTTVSPSLLRFSFLFYFPHWLPLIPFVLLSPCTVVSLPLCMFFVVVSLISLRSALLNPALRVSINSRSRLCGFHPPPWVLSQGLVTAIPHCMVLSIRFHVPSFLSTAFEV